MCEQEVQADRYYDPKFNFQVDTRLVSEAGVRLDNSKRKTFRSCPRKFYWEHYRGLKGQYGSTALRYGNVFHECMRGYYQGVIDNGWGDQALLMNLGVEAARKQWDKLTDGKIFYSDYRTFENCMELFIGYLAFYTDDRNYVEVLHTEFPFEVQFDLTEEERELYPDLPTITSTGKIDLQLKMRGIPWILDFKTTSYAISVVSQSLAKSMQLIHYTWAADKVLGYKPEGALTSVAYSLARKNKAGDYGNLSTDYGRVPVIYTDDDVKLWRQGYIKACNDIYRCYVTGVWPCDFDSCYLYNKQCTYMPLCQQPCKVEDVNTEMYSVEFWDVNEEGD